MVLHDLACENCELEELDIVVDPTNLPKCKVCGHAMEIRYDLTPRRPVVAAVHSRERAVVWRNPRTGKVAYPARNDAPMPARYARRGFERVEMTSLRQLDDFSKREGVSNEKANFDGSGRGAEIED